MRGRALVTGLHPYLAEHDSPFKQIELPLAGLKANETRHLGALLVHRPDAERALPQQPAQLSDVLL